MGNIIDFGKKNIKNIAMAAAGALLLGASVKNTLSISELDHDDNDVEMDVYEVSEDSNDPAEEAAENVEG